MGEKKLKLCCNKNGEDQKKVEVTLSSNVVRHDENLKRLARVEGQIRGISRMIEEGKYCVDILTQLQAAEAAIRKVSQLVLKKHLENCVSDSLLSQSKEDVQEKIDEIMKLLTKATAIR